MHERGKWLCKPKIGHYHHCILFVHLQASSLASNGFTAGCLGSLDHWIDPPLQSMVMKHGQVIIWPFPSRLCMPLGQVKWCQYRWLLHRCYTQFLCTWDSLGLCVAIC